MFEKLQHDFRKIKHFFRIEYIHIHKKEFYFWLLLIRKQQT